MDALSLPPEAWVHVLSFVDADTIANRVGLVSHAFHALATEPQLWRRLVLRDFPASHAAAGSAQQCNLYEGEPDGWRKTFYAHRWLERSKRTRFCLLGHVDCGKSTLLGRMLLGLGKVTQQELNRLRDAAFDWGKGSFMYAWCSDRTDAERQRGITIDWHAKECTLSSGREIEIVDVPGYRDFNKNAFIGASMADVAMLVVAAGLGEFEAGVANHSQSLGGTRHHLMLAKSLGMSKVIVVVNKLDDRSVYGYSQARFDEIKEEVLRIAGDVGYKLEDLTVVPISAWSGENVVQAPSSMPWYNGPMLFEVMEQVARTVTTSAPGEVMAKQRPVFGPTRVSVLRRVNKLCTTGGGTDVEQQKHEEVVQALVQGGMVREGQVLEAVLPTSTPPAPRRRAHVLPQPTTVASFTVLSIQRFQTPRSRAAAGEYVGLRLRLEQLSPAADRATADRGVVRRGMMLLAAAGRAGENALTERVECFTVRFDHLTPARLRCGSEPYFIIHSSTAPYRVEKILRCWDKDGKEVKVAEAPDGKAPVMNLTVGMSTLLQIKPTIGGVCVEPFVSNAAMGTVLMLDQRRLVASGRIETVRQLGSEVID